MSTESSPVSGNILATTPELLRSQSNQYMVTDDSDMKDFVAEETVSYKRTHQHDQEKVEVDLNKIPIMGVLTEPLRGSLHKDEERMSTANEYIPTAHVKFLEQAGIKVVPVSYKMSGKELTQLLDKLNGLYVHGDSLKSL